jgi:transcriptional regulator with AAA-type ATPase domain
MRRLGTQLGTLSRPKGRWLLALRSTGSVKSGRGRAGLGRAASESTTSPGVSTGHDQAGKRGRRVRWVFPLTLSTPSFTGRHVVGRDEACDTLLPGDQISRKHAEFRVDGPVLAVRDLDSRNGVHVNGVRRTDFALLPGDAIRCGEWVGIVVAGDGPDGLEEIAPGWYGGATLAAAVAPARRAGADLPVIVQGETGTGKEGLARAVHSWSGRTGPFVAVNCAALPSQVVDSELFGHRKGAFTGADRASPGLFRAAHGGTIFLDEILELPAETQPKLLRVLEQHEVLPLGETTPVAVDVRVVVATQEPLSAAVSAKRFRADLHARVDGLTVVLPPLRDRREDIVPLFQKLLRQHAGGPGPELDPKLVESLVTYGWPLNVRELVLLARRQLTVHGQERILKRSHLPDRMRGLSERSKEGALTPAEARPARRSTDDGTEFDSLVGALRAHNGVLAQAAEAIGITRARAYRLLAAHPDFSIENERR